MINIDTKEIISQDISEVEAHGGESNNDIKSEIPDTVRVEGANPSPGDILIPSNSGELKPNSEIPNIEKRRGFLVYDETQAINALIYFVGVKNSEGFGINKEGYRVEIKKVEG